MLINYVPSLWYLSADYIKYINSTTGVLAGVKFSYQESAEQITSMSEKIDNEVAKILSGTEGMTQYDKVITFFDYLCDNITYNNEADEKYCSTLYAAFVTRKANCQGYSNALKYLCNKAGIECYTVPGEDNAGMGHMWNIVKLNGQWYMIDATYADGTDSYKRYDYCLTTADKISLSYKIIEDRFQYPVCFSLTDNFYVRSGLFAASATEAVNILTREISKAAKNKPKYVQIMCDSQETYNEAVARILTPESSESLLEMIKLANSENVTQIREDPVFYSASETTYVIRVFLEYE
jgi:hypothetical protein